MCPKVSSQYKIGVKEKIVDIALITFSKYGKIIYSLSAVKEHYYPLSLFLPFDRTARFVMGFDGDNIVENLKSCKDDVVLL